MNLLTAILATLALLFFGLFLRELAVARRRQQREQEHNTMVALLSHRLRTPLSSVKWHTELLLDEQLGKLQISQMELLHKISASITDAIGVLNTFLESSRIELGMHSKPETLDLWQHLQHIVDIHSEEVHEKRQTLVLSPCLDRIAVYIDPLVLHTIVDVLVTNALTYTPEGGKISIDAQDGLTHVTLRVADTGIGLSPKEKAKIFTKFFRSEEAKKISTSGNGLGLYLVQRMLENVGGTIRCESEQGKGTTFYVMLPKDKA